MHTAKRLAVNMTKMLIATYSGIWKVSNYDSPSLYLSPRKEEMKGERAQFVFISWHPWLKSTSSLETYVVMGFKRMREKKKRMRKSKKFSKTFFLRAASAAYGGSQARGWMRAAASSLCHSHSNAGSEPRLRPTPQLMATTPDPQPTEQRQGLNPYPHGY